MEIAVMRWPIGAQGSDESGQCFSGERWQQQSFSSVRRMINTNLLGYSTDRYRPCDGTPNAATVAVTTGRVSLSPCTELWSMKIKKRYFWNSVAVLCLSLKIRWSHWEYRHMAGSAMS
jgi:hypothetical protein